jgi:hypothetical protein
MTAEHEAEEIARLRDRCHALWKSLEPKERAAIKAEHGGAGGENWQGEIGPEVVKTILARKGRGREEGILLLKRSKALRRMNPEDLFRVAMGTVMHNDVEGLKLLVSEAQKQSPIHPEIALFKTKTGETLGHLAARWKTTISCTRQASS